MASVYWGALFVLSAACAVCIQQQYKGLMKMPTSTEFDSFQKRFLLVYFLACSSDWVQGPYIYKLYQFYGFTKSEIGFLFVLGYCSSAVFGTFIGGMADKIGRKKTALAFCVVYGIACICSHIRSYEVLVFGRLCSGISTSMLFSVFESWMNHEHKTAGYLDDWMVKTVSYMTFGSSLSGIGSSVVASGMVKVAGYTAPFDVALGLLIVTFILIKVTWKENYGDRQITTGGNFAMGWVTLTSSSRLLLLGVTQSFFEGTMYCFIFSWTPILEETSFEGDIPHGIIFACFMVAMMLGSFIYQYLIKKMRSEAILKYACVVSGIALVAPAITSSHNVIFLSFCLYETCVGVYFSGMGYLRSMCIPNEMRSTIMNLYRVPLNLFVVIILINISSLSHSKLSSIFLLGLMVAASSYAYLEKMSSSQDLSKVNTEDDQDSKV